MVSEVIIQEGITNHQENLKKNKSTLTRKIRLGKRNTQMNSINISLHIHILSLSNENSAKMSLKWLWKEAQLTICTAVYSRNYHENLERALLTS